MRRLAFVLCLVVAFASAAPVFAQDPPAQQQVIFQEVEKELGPDHYFFFYANTNTGGTGFFMEDRENSTGFGASYTFWGRGIFSAELDFNYNPKFFGAEADYATNNLMTFTANGIIGPWFHPGSMYIRPYAVIGGGLMRSTIDEFASVDWKTTQNRGVFDVGGGLVILFTRNFGIRGDARYRYGVGENDSDDGWGMIDAWKFLRISGGIALAF